MGRYDWYRNVNWDDEIEHAFEQRLRRARDKAQYLKIQAGYLEQRHPQVALQLAERYFGLCEENCIFMSHAHEIKAAALKALDDMEGALTSYAAAIKRQEEFPHALTDAYLAYSCLIVVRNFESMYQAGLDVLDAHRDRPIFPVQRYLAHGARALLLSGLGRGAEARASAVAALAAADETKSGFRYHQNLGLVRDVNDDFGKRVAALVR